MCILFCDAIDAREVLGLGKRIKVKVIVLCALGQLLCSVNSAGSPTARNVM